MRPDLTFDINILFLRRFRLGQTPDAVGTAFGANSLGDMIHIEHTKVFMPTTQTFV